MNDAVLKNFFTADGRLHTVPAKRNKRLLVLDRVAQSFEAGRTYRESEVNTILERIHPDYAALRRYLVDDEFLSREHRVTWVYWRSGGTVGV